MEKGVNPNAIHLGRFELHEVIGRGGMGDVWRATHTVQRIDVAVKVVTAKRARSARAVAAFRNEVHAMARLDHPGVIMVLDVGEVSAEAEHASAGVLAAGSPMLAMELASHGTLQRVREGLHWRRFRAVVLSILDALAHAHARGVVHRDLKPGNILVTADRSGRPVLKLADFGLAHATHQVDHTTAKRKIAGTPKYMAPEQIEGRTRDQGPWTDLYALGCLAHWLLTGEAPYVGELEAILAGHLFEEPPELPDELDVPDGFGDWFRQMLAVDPHQRYRCAADAAYGLVRLDDGEPEALDRFGGGLGEISDARWTEPELSVLEETVLVDSQALTVGRSRDSRPLDGYSATIAEMPPGEGTDTSVVALRPPTERPPMPISWERKTTEGPPLKLVGAGLGLYGLRPVRLVDREAERTALWDELGAVHDGREPRVATLIGSAGSGKSRLANWLCERATEVGAATVLRAFHGPQAGPGDALGRMVADHLRCVGLPRDEVLERVRNVYFSTGPVDGRVLYDCLALTELVSPAPAHDETGVRFGTPSERHVVLTRFVERLSRERPVVVLIDDAQWGLDALDFVRFVQANRRAPVLLLLTVRREDVAEGSAEEERLAAIWSDASRVIDVTSLDDDDHHRLVGELLSLEPDLARRVAERTAGNPLFAVQLVGDWVQRGLLRVTESGFQLVDEANAKLPDSIHQLWFARIEGFLTKNAYGTETRDRLELAAILGQEVDETEWQLACEHLDGARPGSRLVEELVEDGLVSRRRTGFRFSHGMLQESLVRRAGDERRSTLYHLAAAAMLRDAYHDERPDALQRLGEHLFAAGEFDACLLPLLEAADEFGERSDFERSKRIVALRDEALDALGAPQWDERRGEGWHVTVRCLLRQGLVDAAAEIITKCVDAAREHAWGPMRPEFELHLASLARKRGDSERATAQYARALQIFRESDDADERGVAKCLYGLGEVHLYLGEVDTAVGYLENALQQTPAGASHHVGVILTGLASALIRREDFDAARERLREAIDSFGQEANRSGRAAALNMLGELERVRGELIAAEAAYREALDVLRAIGSRGVTIPRLNLGLIYLARARWADAREVLSAGLRELEQTGEMSHIGLVQLALACASAGTGNWPAFDVHFSEARAILDQTGWIDRDIAEHAELAAGLARTAGEIERADAAAALAATQWAGLDGGD